MCHIDRIVSIDKQFDRIIHLDLICMEKFLECFHLFHVAGLRSDLGAFVFSIGKYQFQRTAHIEECRVMPPLSLSCFLRFHASDDIVVSRVLQRQSAADKRRYNHLVIVICRKPDSGTRQLCRLDQKFMRRSIPHTHR
ncbi:unknown [Lachnospiraceae bacterium CAG:215]|nr:unknown [Lachnospiraceae bacterium CAG:215]